LSIISRVSNPTIRQLLQTALFAGTSIILVWILKQAFPKNVGALNLFLILLFLDAFLWMATKKRIWKFSAIIRILLTILYWTPFLLVLAGTIYGFFRSFYAWPPFAKTYLINLVFIFYLSKAIPAIFLLPEILFRGIRLLISRKKLTYRTIQPARFSLIAGWTAGGAIFLLLLSGMIWWQYDFRIRTTEITLQDLPASFDGFRIAQISDLHLGSWMNRSKLNDLVHMINETHPDIVCFTGDLCNYDTEEAWPFQDILSEIKAKDGVFAVLGNHDYGDYRPWASSGEKEQNMLDLKRFYRKINWKLLCNENYVLVRPGETPDSDSNQTDTIAIVGVENWGSLSRFQRLADLSSALKGVESVPIQILLSHDPSHWDSIISREYPDIDLTLAGHTHGGQVGVETGKIRWSIVSSLYSKWAGIYKKENPENRPQYLYVNRGAGTIGYSGRIGIYPEVTLIILRSGRSAN